MTGRIATVVLVLLTLLLPLVLFHETTALYAREWLDTNSNYGHGLLVLGLAGYGLWSQRHTLAVLPIRPVGWGLLPLALLSLVWAAGHLVHVEIAEQMAVAAIWPVLILTLFGLDMLRRCLFPLAFVWMAVPVWDYLMPTLQNLSAAASFRGLQLLGVPVLREGQYISIPTGHFEIAEYCAGLRYLLAALSIGLFFAWQRIEGWRRKFIFIALVIAVALLANWLRVIIVIMAGHLTEMQSPLVSDHATMGWLLFAAVMLPVFWFGGKMIVPESLAVPGRANVVGTATTAGGRLAGDSGRWGLYLFAVVIVLSMGAGIPAIVAGQAVARTANSSLAGIVLPNRLGSWRSMPSPPVRWEPRFHGATREWLGWYQREDMAIGLYVAYYAQQQQGKEVVFLLNTPFDRDRWHGRLAPRREERVSLMEYRLRSADDDERLIWSWYDIGGIPTHSRFVAKALELVGLLTGRRGSAYVALAIDDRSADSARSALRAFLHEAYPGIRKWLEKPGEQAQ